MQNTIETPTTEGAHYDHPIKPGDLVTLAQDITIQTGMFGGPSEQETLSAGTLGTVIKITGRGVNVRLVGEKMIRIFKAEELKLEHNEPDGTQVEYTIQHRYGVQPWEDWYPAYLAQKAEEKNRPRVFKIGAKVVEEDENTQGKTPEEVRSILATSFPEIKNATITEQQGEDGRIEIVYSAQPGRKG